MHTLQQMLETAQKALEAGKPQPYTQAIVLVTAQGNEYCAVIANALSEEREQEQALLDSLLAKGDTEVRTVLCMWHEGSVDLPSLAFRRMLCELNPNNRYAALAVRTQNGYSKRTLESTLPKK